MQNPTKAFVEYVILENPMGISLESKVKTTALNAVLHNSSLIVQNFPIYQKKKKPLIDSYMRVCDNKAPHFYHHWRICCELLHVKIAFPNLYNCPTRRYFYL